MRKGETQLSPDTFRNGGGMTTHGDGEEKDRTSKVNLLNLGGPLLVFPNCFHLSLGKAKNTLIFHGRSYTMETLILFQICFSFD